MVRRAEGETGAEEDTNSSVNLWGLLKKKLRDWGRRLFGFTDHAWRRLRRTLSKFVAAV